MYGSDRHYALIERVKGVHPKLSREELLETREHWFRPMPKERKFKRPLVFFTRHLDVSLGDILSWGWIEKLKVHAIRREFGVQYFSISRRHQNSAVVGHVGAVSDQVYKVRDEMDRTKIVAHYPKKVTKIDPVTKENDVTLHIKRSQAMKDMSLMKLEQDFYEEFRDWYYDSSTVEAVISLRSKETFIWRGIRILDPMWLVNLSKKDVECLFFTNIWYEAVDKIQAMQY
ncbi:hypothetical protein Hanom_Chr13g01201691 [Helianthus anomalus]